MKQFSHSLILLLFAIFIMGCSSSVFDDYSNCPTPSATLFFAYNADGTNNVIGEHITGATLFVYDTNGNLVFQHKLTKEDLTTTNGFKLPTMEIGEYRVVVWGNASNSLITDEKSLANAAIATTFSTSKKNDALYFASNVIAVTDKEDTATILFSSAHIKLEIDCSNFSEVYGAGLSPIIEITNSGSRYPFNQTGIPQPDKFTDYQLPAIYNENTKTHTAAFNSFRFNATNDIKIVIKHPKTNEVLQEVSLQEYIKELTPAVDNRQEVTISIEFEFTDLGVIIKPPVWEGEPITPAIN